jgi:hypothetical protein
VSRPEKSALCRPSFLGADAVPPRPQTPSRGKEVRRERPHCRSQAPEVVTSTPRPARFVKDPWAGCPRPPGNATDALQVRGAVARSDTPERHRERPPCRPWRYHGTRTNEKRQVTLELRLRSRRQREKGAAL